VTRYKCYCCGDIVESKFRHDFVSCKCGKSYVDGGNDYMRVGFEPGIKPPEPIREKYENSNGVQSAGRPRQSKVSTKRSRLFLCNSRHRPRTKKNSRVRK
jgi:hypothetical protein